MSIVCGSADFGHKKMPPEGYEEPSNRDYLLFRWQNFLNTNLVNQVLPPQIYQMRSLFIIGQVRADASGNRHHESVVIHVEPIRATNQFVLAVTHERIIETGG
jgi:hypothetical protein